MVRAYPSHQCGTGSTTSFPGSLFREREERPWERGCGFDSRLGVICGLSLLLFYSAPRGFPPGTPVFPSPRKPTFDLIYVDCQFQFTVSPISAPALERPDTWKQSSFPFLSFPFLNRSHASTRVLKKTYGRWRSISFFRCCFSCFAGYSKNERMRHAFPYSRTITYSPVVA